MGYLSYVRKTRQCVEGKNRVQANVWNEERIYREMKAGAVLQLWSALLKEWVLWSERGLLSTEADRPIASYTLAELEKLSIITDPDFLFHINSAKKLLKATLNAVF